MSAPSVALERRPLDVCALPLSGVHLIEASAGTGKTYTITSLIVRLLVEQERPIDSVLAVTFTNAATAELKSRVYERIEEARRAVLKLTSVEGDPVLTSLLAMPDQGRVLRLLNVAAQNVDRAGIFTIHGFAARMLQDHAFQSGAREDTELTGDQRAIVQDVVTDFWTSRVACLPRQVFEQIGGTSFYRALTKVGLAAASASEVELVPLDPPEDLADEVEHLRALYDTARAAFAEQGQELFQVLLSSTSLNGNKYRKASVEADFVNYLAYFSRGEPTIGHPETDRWTQTKADSSLKKGTPPVEHPLLSVLEALFDANAATQDAVRRFADSLRAEVCDKVRVRVKEEHERAGTQSFDGLLTDLCAALRDPQHGASLAREVRRLMPVALIDEFQDTDPVQYEIFRRIYVTDEPTRGALYLIGDPKQSIYAFRGADVQTYLHAASQATGGVWTLDTSYRASPSLVHAQNALFGRPRDTFCVPGISYQPVKARPGAQDQLLRASGEALAGMQLLFCPDADPTTALRLIAHEVARFLGEGHTILGRPVSPQDIAVLTRTNRQAQDVQALLRQLGIPAVMHGDRSVFESPEAAELRRVLLALAEPGHRVLSRTALATRLLGLNSTDLTNLESDHEELERWTSRLRDWGQLWRTRGIAHAIEALSTETDLPARTLGDRDGERRLTNFRHLLELLHDAQTKEHLGVAGLLRYFEGAISDPSGFAMAAEARQLRLESDAQAVTLTTAHKSKGLEYNIVFLPSLALRDNVFNDEAFRYFDPTADRSLFEMRDKESRGDSDEIHALEARQESLRLAYVALTRAKHHLVALTGPTTGFSSMHYLLHERGAGQPGGLDALITRLKKKLPAEVFQHETRELAEQSEGAIAFALADMDPGPHYQRERGERPLVAPPEAPLLSEKEKTSSFSSMTRGGHDVLSRAAREGRDLDELVEDDAMLTSALVTADSTALGRCRLADFPRGARPGDALHALFEYSPFAEGTAEDRGLVIERQLSRRGFDPKMFESVGAAVEDILAAPFEGFGAKESIQLGKLDAPSRVAEMEFSLPVGDPEHRLSAARLARALGYEELPPNAPEPSESEAAAGGLLPRRYLRSLSELPFGAWSGFLRGFMDLVFVWEGRLYGLDYKSNFLGEDYEDYTRAAMRVSMEEHHYLLQALLYAVAIHRYGKSRIVNYSYEEHFGGMHYLFVRGMHPQLPGNGVFSFRPTEEMVEGLSRVLQEGK